ncbi:LysM peptidoglycan-binding domain-containing protein [Patescibacteria group bacterium]|nr:LysM peptidoglycan-binding domain-containing protein [Patescibacteria group bacterium]
MKDKIAINYSIKLLTKQIIQSFILFLIHLFRITDKYTKKMFSLKQLPIIIILVFLIFSFSEVDTIYRNSFGRSLISQIINKQKVVIETGLPIASLSNLDQENIKPDFEIAGFLNREEAAFDPNEIALTLGGSTLMAPFTEFNETVIQTRTEIEIYTVQPGDTISTIAQKFSLNWSTILWENKLNAWSVIQPGDELRILPLNGISYKVKKGENLSSIAKKYKTSLAEIIQFNDLSETSILEPGKIIILPAGSPPPPPKPKYQPVKPVFVSEDYTSYWGWLRNSKCHKFIKQQCTSWVAFQWTTEEGQCVPSWGNANSWYGNAKRAGYQTGSSPQNGAIMVLTCSSWLCQRYGHVAYVENFNNDTVTISEMNGLKRLAYSKRTIKNITNKWQKGWIILGYIYSK